MIRLITVPMVLGLAGASDAISWPWVIGIALAVAVVCAVYIILRAGKAPGRTIRLVVTKGVHTGEVFTLASAFATVGSEKGNDIVLADDKISRHHARLKYHGGRLEVTDLNTLYGTLVNGRRIDRADCVSGDMLVLGAGFECRVEISARS